MYIQINNIFTSQEQGTATYISTTTALNRYTYSLTKGLGGIDDFRIWKGRSSNADDPTCRAPSPKTE